MLTFSGEATEPTRLLITRDFEICGEGYRERREIDVDPGGGLRNAVVFIDGIDEGKPWPEVSDGYLLNQENCYFAPYVRAMPQGADLRIVNSDPVLHNIHGYELTGEARRTLFNLAQPDKGQITQTIRPRRSQHIGLECDAHDFMLGWIFAATSPYAVLVDSDGRFEIGDIPPGTYTVRAWHPFLEIREQRLTFSASAVEEIVFEVAGP